LYHPHPKRWSTRDRTARALIQSNDVYVAPDGLMYLTDVNDGLTILQYGG
jgi:hypothetical protein